MSGLLEVRRAKLADELALFTLVRQFPGAALPSNEAFATSLRLKLKDHDALVAVAELVEVGVPRKRAADVVARLTGVARNRLYRGSL